jgi:hypothetical protein
VSCQSHSPTRLERGGGFASTLAVAVSGGPTGGPLQVTIVGDVGILVIICVYQPENGQIPGHYSNTDNSSPN